MATDTRRRAKSSNPNNTRSTRPGSSRPKYNIDPNLPSSTREQIRKPASDTNSLSPIDRKLLAEEEAKYKKEVERQMAAEAEAFDHLANLESDLERTDANLNANPADDFSDELLGFDNPSSAARQAEQSPTAAFRPTLGRPDKTPDSSSKYNKPGSAKTSGQSPESSSSTVGEKGEAAKLSSFINDHKNQYDSGVKSKLDTAKNGKVSRFSVKGRAKKRAKIILLSMAVSAITAVPIGILGAIPHGIQSWIANRTSAFVERATDKMGQKLLFAFFRDNMAYKECVGHYNSAAPCRARLDPKNGRIAQLFNDWKAADMEARLEKHGINVTWDVDSPEPGKPYKITIENETFRAAEDFGSADWDITRFTGERESSNILRRQMKRVLKEDTRWHQYLKRRNLKAGLLRDLGLPGRFHGPDTLARLLDERDARRSARHSRWRQNITKHVVNIGEGRLGLFLEIIFSGDKSLAYRKNVIENNKVLRAAAAKLGEAKVKEILEKFAGKTGKQIAKQLLVDLIEKIFNVAIARAAGAALDAIPVIGQVLLFFAILDVIDMLSDGTIQKYLSVQNAQAMMDMANLMDTTLSEERRGFVDVDSAGDMRLAMIKGLSASRVFTNTVGYESPTGQKAAGYDCKPDIKLTDVESILGAIQGATDDNGINDLKKRGMGPDEDACENHRVDYNPLIALNGLFSVTQVGIDMYTERCIFDYAVLPLLVVDLFVPGELCEYSGQDAFHDINSLLAYFTGVLQPIMNFIMSIPLIESLTNKFMSFFLNMLSIFISGYSLTGPELLQGGLQTDTKSGAKMFDAWEGGQQVIQNNFGKGVGDGGGLGSMTITPQVAQEMNTQIAQERREELASGSIYDRWFDIGHADTLASSVMNVAVVEGSASSFLNPLHNIAAIFNGSTSSTYAEGSNQPYCGETNRFGEAATEFGVVCYTYPDAVIDNLSEEDMVKYSDPDYCEKFNIAWDKAIVDHEDETYPSPNQDPDGSGQPDSYNPCRLMCSVTDVMGTNFRKKDPICGFEKFGAADDAKPSSSGGGGGGGGGQNDNPPSTPGVPPTPAELGKCADAPLTRPNEGKPNDIYIVVVPGTTIDIRADLCDSVLAMVQAAAADGTVLNGGGFRTYDEQVQLRKDHCGSSYYAIYEMPSGSCRPQTARPGHSNHEFGQAIDFDNCKSKQSDCHLWLKSNAAKFGFFNLPSEAWHWSIDGN